MDRRAFLRLSRNAVLVAGAHGVLGSRTGLFAAPRPPKRVAAKPTLICVFLRGGIDQLNVVVPHGDERYYQMRPTIAVPKPSGDPEVDGALELDKYWGLHPAMEALKPWWDRGKFGVVLNVGSPHPTRSHFDAQDFMEYGAPGLRSARDGWLNRFLQATKGPEERPLRALAMQGLLPRSLRGQYPVAAVPDSMGKIDKVLDAFDGFYGAEDKPAANMPAMDQTSERKDDPVIVAGQETVKTLRHLDAVLAKGKSTKTSYPGGKFAAGLRDLATVIKAGEGLEVGCVDINGWDHHAGEGALDGALNRMLQNLSDSLASFMEDLGEHLDHTLIMTYSEFGRVCKENGNEGTDHGHGGLMMLMGAGVQGGKIHGIWPGLDPARLYQGRDLEVTTDFRDVLAEILREHQGFKAPRGFFPDYSPGKGLGLFAKKSR